MFVDRELNEVVSVYMDENPVPDNTNLTIKRPDSQGNPVIIKTDAYDLEIERDLPIIRKEVYAGFEKKLAGRGQIPDFTSEEKQKYRILKRPTINEKESVDGVIVRAAEARR